LRNTPGEQPPQAPPTARSPGHPGWPAGPRPGWPGTPPKLARHTPKTAAASPPIDALPGGLAALARGPVRVARRYWLRRFWAALAAPRPAARRPGRSRAFRPL